MLSQPRKDGGHGAPRNCPPYGTDDSSPSSLRAAKQWRLLLGYAPAFGVIPPLAVHRSGSALCPISARAWALDSNSSPDMRVSLPNRSANSFLTAGTKEVPPVKNTFSTSRAV